MQLFVNDLTVIDFSYLCQERGIVGESWIVDVILDGDLNEASMVLDFGIVKKQIKAIIDDAVDHKLLLPVKNTSLVIAKSHHHADHQCLDFHSKRGSYYLQSPSCAFAHIRAEAITIETVTRHISDIILAELPDNVAGLSILLRPEQINSDYYHYSHGLKKHDGNCQRIAHGHRSKIGILVENVHDTALEHEWAQRWQDIYIASETDRISQTQVQLSTTAKLTDEHQCFAYVAPQGRFDIAVPSAVLEVVDCDSTVELLADYIYRQLAKQYPEKADQLTVIAYEGVGKGAIAHGE